jgi:hypothetical protein
MFDGRLTAHAAIPDVRVGDIVDVCFSLAGAHPILQGRFCAEWILNWQCWVGETRVRLICGPDRSMVIEPRNDPPVCEITALATGEVVRTWRTAMTPPVVLESFTPPWIRPFMGVRAGDAMTWSDVADTFRGDYDAEPLPGDLESAIETLKVSVEGDADRLVRALNLVQESLRYQAITLGDGGFVPRAIEAIWRSRTGDCKDASRLLSAILGHLGVPSEPVLVNTRVGRILDGDGSTGPGLAGGERRSRRLRNPGQLAAPQSADDFGGCATVADPSGTAADGDQFDRDPRPHTGAGQGLDRQLQAERRSGRLGLRRTLTFERTCLEADEAQAFVDFREALLKKASVAVRVPARFGVVKATTPAAPGPRSPAPAAAGGPGGARKRRTVMERVSWLMVVWFIIGLVTLVQRMLSGAS